MPCNRDNEGHESCASYLELKLGASAETVGQRFCCAKRVPEKTSATPRAVIVHSTDKDLASGNANWRIRYKYGECDVVPQ